MEDPQMARIRQTGVLAAALVGVICAAAHGDLVPPCDLDPPSWRGTEGSTLQAWGFGTADPKPPPDKVQNPYGTPALTVRPVGDWQAVLDGREGVWPLSGEVDLYIPNRLALLDFKEIWIQLLWKPQAGNPNPALPDEPATALVANPPPELIVMTYQDVVQPDGWILRTTHITLERNPVEEWITMKGDIWVDCVIIDTRCVPEPTAIAFLAIGGLVIPVLRRRRGR
jgi:hypothetical protein